MREVYRVHQDALPPAPEAVVQMFMKKGTVLKSMKKFAREVSSDLRWKGYGVVGASIQRLENDTRGYNMALMMWSWLTSESLSPPGIPPFGIDDVDRWVKDWPTDKSSVINMQREALSKACRMPKRAGWAIAQAASALISPKGLSMFHFGLKTLITASTLQRERRVSN